MNVVSDLIDAVSFRVGDVLRRRSRMNPAGIILRYMQDVYRRLNEEFLVIEKEWSIDFGNIGANDSLEDGYFALPEDWIRPYKLDPYYEFREPEVFDKDESYTFTIHLNRIYFSNVNADTQITCWYYADGDTLVSKEDSLLQTGETNTPQYPRRLYSILIYGTACELGLDYPAKQEDLYKFSELKTLLNRVQHFKQNVTPEQDGPGINYANTDDYGDN